MFMFKPKPAIMYTVTAFILGLTILATMMARDPSLERKPKREAEEEWRRLLQSEALGCSPNVADPYEWRLAGYGSNMNFLLLAWANAILDGRNDLAVIANTQLFFPRTSCLAASDGQETRSGWPCIFAQMPHLCAFDSDQIPKVSDDVLVAKSQPKDGEYMQPYSGKIVEWAEFTNPHARRRFFNKLWPSEQEKASRRDGVKFLRSRIPFIEQSVDGSGMDTFGFLAMLYEHLNSHLQPWFEADVEAILAEPDITAVRTGKYVSMHIRRTDKAIEVQYTETKEYFTRAFDYLSTSPSGLNATEITGLWLSTDDDIVFDEVKSLTPQYFPGVKPEAVVFVTNRVPMRGSKRGTADAIADRDTYEAVVLLRVELLMLAGAEAFSGTFSSNIGRIVALMRETLGKPKESALSSDTADWFPG